MAHYHIPLYFDLYRTVASQDFAQTEQHNMAQVLIKMAIPVYRRPHIQYSPQPYWSSPILQTSWGYSGLFFTAWPSSFILFYFYSDFTSGLARFHPAWCAAHSHSANLTCVATWEKKTPMPVRSRESNPDLLWDLAGPYDEATVHHNHVQDTWKICKLVVCDRNECLDGPGLIFTSAHSGWCQSWFEQIQLPHHSSVLQTLSVRVLTFWHHNILMHSHSCHLVVPTSMCLIIVTNFTAVLVTNGSVLGLTYLGPNADTCLSII
jgi:hypothetical protein